MKPDRCLRPVILVPQKSKAGESQIEGKPGLLRQLMSSIRYLMRPCLNAEGLYGIPKYVQYVQFLQ